MKAFFIILAVVFLTACRIDLTVNGDGKVQTESNSFECGSGSTNCVQSYVIDVAECPGYNSLQPNTIPDNCTVIVDDYDICIAMTNETPANCVYDTGVLEIFHALAGEGSEFTYWGGDDNACNGSVNHLCSPWISADGASGTAEVAIEANFTQDIDPDDASYTYNHLGQRNQTPFGETKGEYGLDGLKIPLRFVGQYADSESGFSQNHYRDYDPSLGRYIQPDPRGQLLNFSDPDRQVSAQMGIAIPEVEQSGELNHSYGYVDQNPVINIDPTGEGGVPVGPLIFGGFVCYCVFLDDDLCTTWARNMVDEEREKQKKKPIPEPDPNTCNEPGVCRNGQLTNQ